MAIDDGITDPRLTFSSEGDISFEKEGGIITIDLTSNRDWSVYKVADANWIKVSPDKGLKGDATITIEAESNDGEARKCTLKISASTIDRAIIIDQKAGDEHHEKKDENEDEDENENVEPNNGLASDLLFSEYVEGSNNNKYLEIYNGTGVTIDLSDYKIELYVNGQTKPKSIEVLTGTLSDGEVVVFRHSKAEIYDGQTTVSTAINFNGNDAITLRKISTDAYVDIFGCIGHDPGKAWIAPLDSEVSTMNKTLIRKPSVRAGVTANPREGFPTLDNEWIVYPIDTSDFLGSHTMVSF